MAKSRERISSSVDWITVIIYAFMVIFGAMNIFSTTYNAETSHFFDLTQSHGKQILWILLSVLIIFVIFIIDVEFFTSFSFVIYAVVCLMLVAVLLVGNTVAGSKSWFVIGSIKIQPSEFAKFATALGIARYLSLQNVKMDALKTRIITVALFAFPAGLIFLQNDTGSALVYAAFFLLMYREGLSGNLLIIAALAVIIFVASIAGYMWVVIALSLLVAVFFFWQIKKTWKSITLLIGIWLFVVLYSFSATYIVDNILAEHQRSRVYATVGIELEDSRFDNWNVEQSLIAIGSGGFAGKGFLKGTQTQFNWVPAQTTDFIFSTVGEEWGFLGCFVVIGLFAFLLIRLVIMAERQRSSFARIYGYAVISILAFHFLINVGMTIGIIPVIGIPLPFFSYGGSSLWGFTILLFIFVKLDAHRLQLL